MWYINEYSEIKTDKDFLELFYEIYDYYYQKNKSEAELYLLKRLTTVKSYIEEISNIEGKEGFDNFIPFFEMDGGRDMIQSNQGKKAIRLMQYFVNNYKK